MPDMTLNEVRQKYLDFFAKRKHAIIPSAPLVPENDPTTLFTGSGMQPLVPYLLGQPHPAGKRLANSQKCFRSEDIDEVGDNRHTTFFEMLGNWSLGDYWKEEQLGWFFEFLTKEIGIDTERLWVTCFEGDKKLNLPPDTESAEIWQKLGIPKEKIFYYGAKKNWWSRSGAPENMPVGEPGGPDSEVFYEFTEIQHDKKFGDHCHPNCDCGRFMEVGNSVFMEYRKTSAGFEKLKQRNVDFGGGLERITAASNNNLDIFNTDLFQNLKETIEESSQKRYGKDEKQTKAFRVVMDHIRASVFLITDRVIPSNTEQGYILRRLLRRAQYYFNNVLGGNVTLSVLAQPVVNIYKTAYTFDIKVIEEVIIKEEAQFKGTVLFGEKLLEKMIKEKGEISAENAFLLYSTYGYPFELIQDIANGNEINLDIGGFQKKKMEHQQLSKKGAKQKFKGGLADTSEMSLKYHTATHLLHQALRDVLGKEVWQKGSNITPERLRFDFAFPRKLTDGEKKQVEDIVNEKIGAGLPVQKIVLPKAEAEKTGALHFFGEKYGDMVNVYFIGDSIENAYSKEFCGGPHVGNTSELVGTFRILKEEAVSAGVRRIKATLG